MMETMSLAEATEFFSDFYFGEHHIPHPIKPHGFGWSIIDRRGLATYDSNHLTRLVVMAHDRCIRAEIIPAGPRGVRITIHKRDRDAESMALSHPTLEDAIAHIRSRDATKHTVPDPVAAERRRVWDVLQDKMRYYFDIGDNADPGWAISNTIDTLFPDGEPQTTNTAGPSPVELLKDLADLQNGPPLEQHRKEWEETMDKVYKCLSEHGL